MSMKKSVNHREEGESGYEPGGMSLHQGITVCCRMQDRVCVWLLRESLVWDRGCGSWVENEEVAIAPPVEPSVP